MIKTCEVQMTISRNRSYIPLLKKITAFILILCIALTLIPLSTSSLYANAQETATVTSVAVPNKILVDEFVTRLYNILLSRKPDPSGFENWTGLLMNGSQTGASVAYGFVFSEEMESKNLTNREFVELLYLGFLGRKPDKDGWDHWVSLLAGGYTKHNVFGGFAHSDEFTQICDQYGIIRGTVKLQPGQIPKPSVSGETIKGNTMITKVWNLIAQGNFAGISDRPEHIAGIIGNMMSETGSSLCPFQQEIVAKHGIGLMQWSFIRRTRLENYMYENGINKDAFEAELNKHTDHVCKGTEQHPQDLLNKAIEIQIRFMFREFNNPLEEKTYLEFIDHAESKTGAAGARAYAELFCALVLRPAYSADDVNLVTDPGVIKAIIDSPYAGGIGVVPARLAYNGLNARRTRAENVYNNYYLDNKG